MELLMLMLLKSFSEIPPEAARGALMRVDLEGVEEVGVEGMDEIGVSAGMGVEEEGV